MSARARHHPWFRDPADFAQRCAAELAGDPVPGIHIKPVLWVGPEPFEPFDPLPTDAFAEVRAYLDRLPLPAPAFVAVPCRHAGSYAALRAHYSNRL